MSDKKEMTAEEIIKEQFGDYFQHEEKHAVILLMKAYAEQEREKAYEEGFRSGYFHGVSDHSIPIDTTNTTIL